MKVNCPTCGIDVAWSDNAKFRPFCSKRCQIIDLGDWAEEQNTIPGKPSIDPDMMSDEQLEQLVQSFEE